MSMIALVVDMAEVARQTKLLSINAAIEGAGLASPAPCDAKPAINP